MVLAASRNDSAQVPQRSFNHIPQIVEIPNLIQVQLDSFEELKTTGKVDTARYGSRLQVADLLGLQEVYELESKYGVN